MLAAVGKALMLLYAQAQKFPSEANKTCVIAPHIAQQEPIDAEGRAVKRIMPTDEPLKFWYTRKGYNDFMVRSQQVQIFNPPTTL